MLLALDSCNDIGYCQLLRLEVFSFCNFQVLCLPLSIISINTMIPKAILEDEYKGEVLQRKTEGYKTVPEISVVKANQW